MSQRFPMIDSYDRVTAEITFSEDIFIPGMLHGKIYRSIYPHARITKIDTSQAEALPGVITVLTGKDIVDRPDIDPTYGVQIKDQPIVAIDRVRYVGDPIVAVAAITPDIAAEAMQYIDVEVEPLPAVYNEFEAAQSDAPLVHDMSDTQLGSNAYFGIRPIDNTNICNHFKMRYGDIEQGFAQADHIVEGRFTTPTAAHVPMERHAVVAHFEDDELVLYSGTQSPFNVRKDLAAMFKMPAEKIIVVVPRLGGGFGAKMFVRLEAIAAMLAKKSRRPIRVALERDEEFLTINRHPVTTTMKLGVTNKGQIVAKQVEAYYGTGAYADCGPNVAMKGGFGSVGPYKIPNFAADSYCVYTNLPPNGAYRGYAVTQVAWASEALMDEAAKKIGMSPLEFRLKNVLRDGDQYPTEEIMHDTQYEACLKAAAVGIDWQLKDEPPQQFKEALPPTVRGKGFAAILKGMTTPSRSEAAVELDDAGNMILHMATIDLGQGCRTVMAQCVGQVLDIPYHTISVVDPDTSVTPFDNRTSSSRSAHMMSEAVTVASQDLKTKLLDLAADTLEVDPDDLILKDGFIQVVGTPDSKISLGEVVKQSGLARVRGDGQYHNEGGLDPETGKGIASSHWHQGAVGVEVEVDIQTGFVRLLRCHPAIYAGRVLNPQSAAMQTDGSTIMGIGSTFFEEIAFNDGQAANLNLSDYMIPSFLDMAEEMNQSTIEIPDADVHGLGETALPLIPAAVGNAVANALGIRIYDLPLTPERVLRAIKAAEVGNDT